MKKLTFLSILTLAVIVQVSSQNLWYGQSSGTNKFLTDVFFVDQNTGWITGWTGTILYTNNGGNVWTPQSPPPSNAYEGIYFTDEQTGWAVGYGGKIIHTSDGGTTWNFQTSGTQYYLQDVQFIDENTGWAAGGRYSGFNIDPVRQILFTDDGGTTWTSQMTENDKPPVESICIVDENYGFAVGETGTIVKTSDGGASWTEIMYDQQYHFYGVDFINPDTGWVVGTDLSLDHFSVLMKTTDGGSNWELQTFGTNESLQDICFVDELKGWAVGGAVNASLILYTTDGGDNWIYENAGNAGALTSVCFVDEEYGWAVGYNGTILHTITTVGVDEPENANEKFSATVYPVPLTNSTTIEYHLDQPSNVSLMFYDQTGKVMRAFQEDQPSGRQQLQLSTESLPAGLYFYIIQAGTRISSGKVIKL